MVSVRPSYGGYLDEYYGISTDSKPTHDHVVNGSTFVEMDTGFKYLFDAQNRQWIKQSGSSSSQSGGSSSGSSDSSGSSGSGIHTVNMEFAMNLSTFEYELVSFDSTYSDIYARISNGEPVLLHVHTTATSEGNTITVVEGHAFMTILFSMSTHTQNLRANVILESNNGYMTTASIVLDSSDNVVALLNNYTIPYGGETSQGGGGTYN